MNSTRNITVDSSAPVTYTALVKQSIWIDSVNNQLCYVDEAGVQHCITSGGIGITPAYGSFFDSTDQSALLTNTAYAMKYGTVDLATGVSVANNGLGDPTRITTTAAGVYNLQFSAQIQKTSGGGSDTITIWIRKNDITDVPDSSTQITLANNGHLVVAAWNWFVSLGAGEYVEIMWSVTATTIRLENLPAVAPYPAIPSVIATIQRVA